MTKQQIEEKFDEKFIYNDYLRKDWTPTYGLSTIVTDDLKSFLFSTIEDVLKECLPKEFENSSIGYRRCRSEFIKKAELLGFKVD